MWGDPELQSCLGTRLTMRVFCEGAFGSLLQYGQDMGKSVTNLVNLEGVILPATYVCAEPPWGQVFQ